MLGCWNVMFGQYSIQVWIKKEDFRRIKSIDMVMYLHKDDEHKLTTEKGE